MKRFHIAFLITTFLFLGGYGCAPTTEVVWVNPNASNPQTRFVIDSADCEAQALQRVAPLQAQYDRKMSPGGAYYNNPMLQGFHGTAELRRIHEAKNAMYAECLSQRGWRLVTRTRQ